VVRNAGGLCNAGGKHRAGVGEKKGYLELSTCDFKVHLARYDNFDSHPVVCWLINITGSIFHLSLSWRIFSRRNLETRLITRNEDILKYQAML
jgi:hypothetical protein